MLFTANCGHNIIQFSISYSSFISETLKLLIINFLLLQASRSHNFLHVSILFMSLTMLDASREGIMQCLSFRKHLRSLSTCSILVIHAATAFSFLQKRPTILFHSMHTGLFLCVFIFQTPFQIVSIFLVFCNNGRYHFEIKISLCLSIWPESGFLNYLYIFNFQVTTGLTLWLNHLNSH